VEDVWDRLAPKQYLLLNEKKDLTFHNIFLPTIIDIIGKDNNFKSYCVLDAGCGTGYLSGIVSKFAHNVIGIDTSSVSINIAKYHNRNIDNISFIIGNLGDYLTSNSKTFDFVLAHLVLHTLEDLNSTLQVISNCLKSGGQFLFSIPHPCFWALASNIGTWRFLNSSNYKYYINSAQQNITVMNGEEYITPYYHRTIETYTSCLNNNGFVIRLILEPIPDDDMMLRYNLKPWPYPRFLFVICQMIQ